MASRLRGRIVAGGKSKNDRDLSLYLRNDFRSVRNAVRIAAAIGRRFFEYDKHGQQIALAEAKTDQRSSSRCWRNTATIIRAIWT